jgi:isoaspartyl peptidase/L-asparaginase-like protein (Ntn-hydrolase superfamily)
LGDDAAMPKVPVIVATWSFGARGNASAWGALEAGGSALDAVERACATVDAAADVDSVGYGGLPDAAGRVSLDGCIMLSPARAGGACVLRRHLHPVSVARRVMERTPHLLLAGPDADAFADAEGFPEAELLAPEARAAWERWRVAPVPIDQSADRSIAALRPVDRRSGGDGRLFGDGAPAGQDEARWKHHDTIGTLCIDAAGRFAGACSTSGTPFKIPGRVGDSPIIGHGLYVDPSAGGATATGTGELAMGVCASFLAVEFMRQGCAPTEAARRTLERILANVELRPHHQLGLIAMLPDGAWGSAALRPGFRVAAQDADGPRVVDADLVLVPDSGPEPAPAGIRP